MLKVNDALGSGETSNTIDVIGAGEEFVIFCTGTFGGEAFTLQIQPQSDASWSNFRVDGESADVQWTQSDAKTIRFCAGAKFRLNGDGNGTAVDVDVFTGGPGVLLPDGEV